MRLDNSLKEFTEKYNHEMIESIETISQDFGLRVNGYTIKAFNINEAFNTFNSYIRGYADYKIKNANNPDASPQEAIRESVYKTIDTQMITESAIKYEDLPSFVKAYIEGVNTTLDTISTIRENMIMNDVSGDAVGDLNDFADRFIERVNESFDPAMDRILWASGYKFREKMKIKPTARPVFL